MNDSIKKIFASVMSGNMVDLKSAIDDTMMEKIANQLENKKIEVAKNLVGQTNEEKKGPNLDEAGGRALAVDHIRGTSTKNRPRYGGPVTSFRPKIRVSMQDEPPKPKTDGALNKIKSFFHKEGIEESFPADKRGRGTIGNSTVSKNAYKPVKHGESDGPVDFHKTKGSTYLKYQHASGAHYIINNPGQDHTGLTSSFKAAHFDKEGKKTKDDFKNIAHLKAYTKAYHKKLGESIDYLEEKKMSDHAIAVKAHKGEKVGNGGFNKVANKAESEYGSKEAGEKVAAAVMWKKYGKKEDEDIDLENFEKFLIENYEFEIDDDDDIVLLFEELDEEESEYLMEEYEEYIKGVK